MKTLAINSDNDIYLDGSGNLAVKSGLKAMADIIVNKIQTNRGELMYNGGKGIDYFNTIFSSPCYPDLFQNQLISEIEETDAVQQVSSYDYKTENGVYSYTVKIMTDYGEAVING